MNSPVAKAYIFAAKQAKDRAELTAWMDTQKPRMQANLAPAEANAAIEAARQHYRELPR